MDNISKQIYEADAMRRKWAESDYKRDSNIKAAKVKEIKNIPYVNSEIPDEQIWQLADIYYSKNTGNEKYPVVVSVHGGGWFYGDKELYGLYTKFLASKGFAVVNFNYRLSPEHKYPSGFLDVCKLMNFIYSHADKYMLDMERLYMVGDSAGAQLTSQYSVAAISEEYRSFFPEIEGMTLPIPAKIALNCGIYEILPPHNQQLCSWYLPENMSENLIESATDIMSYMNANFPESYVMTSFNDPLRNCSDLLLNKLKELDISHFHREFGKNDPDAGHVFHLNLNSPEAHKCNEEEVNFFKGIFSPEGKVLGYEKKY